MTVQSSPRRRGAIVSMTALAVALMAGAGLAPASALPAPPACAGQYVSDVQVSNVGSTTATVTWVGLAVHERFLVYANNGIGIEHRTSSPVYAPTNTFTFTDLVPDRTYTVSVQGVCSNSFGPHRYAPEPFHTLP